MGLPIIPQALCALGPWEHEFEWQSARETENDAVKKQRCQYEYIISEKQNTEKYDF